MKFDGSSLMNAVSAPYSNYQPEQNNNYDTKLFKLVSNYESILENYEKRLPKSASILQEAKHLINKGAVRSYNTDAFCKVDSVNLLACLGLNENVRDIYTFAIYDMSVLLPVVLSAFFSEDLEVIENKLAKMLVRRELSYTDFVNAFSSRWETSFGKVRLNDLSLLDRGFSDFVDYCSESLMRDELCIGGIKLSKSEYSENEAVNIAFSYIVKKMQEAILEELLKEKVQCHNADCSNTGVVVISKGIDNVILASSSKDSFKPLEFTYGPRTIQIHPILANSNELGYSYLEFRSSALGLLTAE